MGDSTSKIDAAAAQAWSQNPFALGEHRPATLRLPDGRQVTLARDQTLIVGSDPGAGLRLRDRYVSARHLAIYRDDPGLLVEDLKSTNGTFLDGVRIERAWAGPGSILRLGDHRIEVRAQDDHGQNGPLLGNAAAFRSAVRYIAKVARLRAPVLVNGETGTGKELAARALHDQSPRADHRFVALNCATITEHLAESQLFGHVRGAFTGATRDRGGAFVEASGGTLFLDEIGELPAVLQAKLLRVLEGGRVQPVGSEVTVPVDVRVVAATHRDLRAMVAMGTFREDLFHRLSVLEVVLPPLRERREDIPLLLRHFADAAGREVDRRVELSQEAVEAACRYAWPGNIRALRNAVTRAAALADGPIRAADLLPDRADLEPQSSAAEEPPPGNYASLRRAILLRAVEKHGSIRKAAPVLGIPRSTLATWLKGEE